MNREEKLQLIQGMFNGADLSNAQINVIVESGAKVVYKEVSSAKNDNPQVTDEQIANALLAINGKEKPLDEYQVWLGACCILTWKYRYPRKLEDCCKRINSLPLEGIEIICKYENIRKFSTYSFVKEDARLWNDYKPKESERVLFNKCLSVAQALDTEIQRQIETE